MTARLTGWNYRAWGTLADPIRQSALNDIASQNGCGRRYFLARDAEARGEVKPRTTAHWHMTLGTAVHAVIERALTRQWATLVELMHPTLGRGERTSPNLVRSIERAYDEELHAATKCPITGEHLPIEWRDENPADEKADAVAMIIGALRTTVERASQILGCEVPFRVELDGYVLEGTIDLLYEPRGGEPGHVAIADWKSGERKMDQIILDHGYQPAIYSEAVHAGVLWPNEPDRAVTLNTWPAGMHIVHLRDFVPYKRAPRSAGKKVGDERGPGWYPSHRTEQSIARLRVSIRNVVGMVRMGRFLEQLGEQCRRCPYSGPCLTDGAGPSKSELRAVERALEGINFDETGLPRVA